MTESELIEKRQQRQHGRRTFMGILLTFFGPLALAIFLFANLELWNPSSTANHGQLMDPVRPLPYLNLQQPSGETLTLEAIKGRWTLVLVADGDCDLLCQTDLFKMRQARAALGRDLVRVQYLYLALDDRSRSAGEKMQSEHPKMLLGSVHAQDKNQQILAFEQQPQGFVYLLDPLGNLVLRYDDESTTKGIIKDLKRLLKVSKIG